VTKYDVVGIGNAIVDVSSREGAEFIEAQGLTKSSMQLVDAETATHLYSAMASGSETSGGSAANTLAGLASFGAQAAFIGKVHDDQLGEVFRHDIRALGVDFDVAPSTTGLPTGRCLVVVTPDAARTMSTFLGAASILDPDDIDVGLAGDTKVLYCEGYIWDIDISKQAIRKAISVTKARGNKISFTASDSFCVTRHHREWLDLIDGTIDLLFANEDEICTLFDTDDFWHAVEQIKGKVEIAAITRSEKGSVIVTATETIEIPAEPIDELVDTSGAGDQYAAGFLYGYTQNLDLATCGKLASVAAAEVIQHLGARPEVSLAGLARKLLDV